jgi:hypothetical protein
MLFSWLNETWPLWTDHIGLLITIGTAVWIVAAWFLSTLLQVMGIPQPQPRVTTPYYSEQVTFLGSLREAITHMLVNPTVPLWRDTQRVVGGTILMVVSMILFFSGYNSAPINPIFAPLHTLAGIVLAGGGILGLLAWLRLFLKIAYLNS